MIELWKHRAFSVLGREGSTEDGAGFIASLWQAANEHFGEIAPHVVYDESGSPAWLWGLMSDFSRSLRPWEDHFSRGLYLAGAECAADAPVPSGWVKWDVPAFVYARFPVGDDAGKTFSEGLAALESEGYTMAAAAFDLTVPSEGRSYVCFPIQTI